MQNRAPDSRNSGISLNLPVSTIHSHLLSSSGQKSDFVRDPTRQYCHRRPGVTLLGEIFD